jgi:hypothetical protein
MIIYGGAATLGGAPADPRLHVFTFSNASFTSGTWSEVTLPSGPTPRYDHAMALSPHPWAGPPNRRIGWLYGGQFDCPPGNPDCPRDTLWRLIIGADTPTTFSWESGVPTGSAPIPTPGERVGHTMLYDGQSNRLSLVGGSTATPADRYMYQTTIQPTGTLWTRGKEATVSLSGHAVGYDPNIYKVVARIPEIYDPATSTWTSHPLAARFEDYYPLQFLVPRSPFSASSCRVVVAGPRVPFEFLDVPLTGAAGSWQTVAHGDPGFSPYTAAMYQPGRILAAGGMVANPWPTPPSVVGSAVTLDAPDLTNGVGWVASPGMTHPRLFHNLVVLPTGQVLAVGGLDRYIDGYNWDPADAVLTPERWDPATRTWASWSASGAVLRNYHSAAVLLPDGRLLQGGGWYYNKEKTVWNPNWKKLELFCPPYLFQSDGVTPAQRPVIASAPDNIRWQQVFSVCVDDPSTIASACLIRPAAITHGFDSNQRFVPLGITGYAGTAPADDASIPPSGAAQSFDLRGHTVPLVNQTAWTEAVFQAQDESAPGAPGSWGAGHIEGLQPCTSYHFGVRARDDHSQDGGFASATFQTSCDGGGGGYAAHGTRDEGMGSASGGPAAGLASASAGEEDPAGAASLAGDGALLVAATRRTPSGGWRVTLRIEDHAPGADAPAATITVESDGAGAPADTLARFQPGADQHLLGLCALRERGRLGIPGVTAIEHVAPAVRARGGDLALAAAHHARLGPLGPGFLAAGGPVELSPGDSLILTYDPAPEPVPTAAAWYTLVRRTGEAPPIPMISRRGRIGETSPARFALHQNRPNPFRGTTVIAFDLAADAEVSLAVFDLLGRRVATLADRVYPAVADPLREVVRRVREHDRRIARLARGERGARLARGVRLVGECPPRSRSTISSNSARLSPRTVRLTPIMVPPRAAIQFSSMTRRGDSDRQQPASQATRSRVRALPDASGLASAAAIRTGIGSNRISIGASTPGSPVRLRDEARPQPPGQRDLGDPTCRQPDHDGHDLLLLRRQRLPVQPEKDRHRHERDPLVPVAVGMIAGDPVSVGGGQRREVR